MTFPVGRIGRLIRDKYRNLRVSVDTPVYVAAVLEYLCAEIVEISGFHCLDSKKKIIKPTHIEIPIRKDKDFARLL